ncbi:MAG TPA: MerR family transcriptional regulator [Catalimonadaceae bacterium]|nr:MerR family transcriptional regulator [Catalimonadaceae bacterium]HPI10205.1 MerR family transcriptional regulator [Catalimonadaceae bacterium]
MSEREALPDKVYYSIGEIARHFGVSTSLIRYWEDEFPHITPRKNGKGDRRYNKADIEKVARIYELIKEKGFTIRGAQAFLTEKPEKTSEAVALPSDNAKIKERLLTIRSYLIDLKDQLEKL